MSVTETPDVLIVGGGPAGLTAAVALRRQGVQGITVVEREPEAGGVPRHCDHQGFGLRDLHRSLTGPAYAARLRDAAARAGIDVRTSTMVTGWDASEDGAAAPSVPVAWTTSRHGRARIAPRAVLLATGVRERPRSARLIAGVRATGGVLTTGTLQQQVYLEHHRVPGRTVIVGAEHVSYSALATLRHGGASPIAMVTEQARHETWAPVALGGRFGFGVPLRTRVRVRRILGVDRVTGIELEDLDSGRLEQIACDRVLLTGDWIADYELAVAADVTRDVGTGGPRVDQTLRTDRPGVFAAGNLLHPTETGDVAALDGRHVAGTIARWLQAEGGAWTPGTSVPVEVDAPLKWVAPNVVVPGGGRPPRDRFAVRTLVQGRRLPVRVTQGDRELWRGRLSHAGPARCSTLPAGWVDGVDPSGGPVRIAGA